MCIDNIPGYSDFRERLFFITTFAIKSGSAKSEVRACGFEMWRY